MEQSAPDKIAQNMAKSCSANFLSNSPQKEVSVETHHLEDLFSSPTPVKMKEPARIKSKEDLTKLPEKYGALLEFFERMTSSLRLLSLRKRTPTFQNISCQVEILTGRKFLFTHLAQMKHILPEAVQIDKILVHDEKTKCMKPHMTIGLLFDAVKDHGEESVYVALSKLFSSRLREFCITHPEGCDVPEAELPEPFGLKTIAFKKEADSISEDLSTSRETNLSHFSPSFKMNFSQKAADEEMEKTIISSPVKSAREANVEINEEVEKEKAFPGSSSTVSMCEITPVKLILASDSVVVETPVLYTPMRPISPTRSVLTCEDDNKMTGSQNGKQPTSNAKKALDFYGMDDQGTSFSHKHASVSLSDFVCSIHRVFQSVDFCPITKEELVQKVMMNNFEFDDLREVEMQMEDLEKLVPDWFCKKLTRSGDLIYSVQKITDLNSVCERVNLI
ncbi:cdt1-like protein a chloroplastic [Phtheirospermum japonicum]|uniref:Cdt1-like protein a chloroplastic n=1 Tax=Phtheirospermum japonicum TaxID=374723 RepID=A0A830BRI6_9LAMI|nr:cdt1-like protein a chloroplastic [Phtheirospermum japonicum]